MNEDEFEEIEVTIKQDSIFGWIMLLFEFGVITWGISSMLCHEGLHIVFSIIIGLACAIIFFLLARLPYVGRLFQAALGLVWAVGIYYFINNIFHYSKDVGLMVGLKENDQLSWWAIVIVDGLICVAAHVYWFNKYLGKLQLPHRKPKQ